jgi:hypothetical protein
MTQRKPPQPPKKAEVSIVRSSTYATAIDYDVTAQAT